MFLSVQFPFELFLSEITGNYFAEMKRRERNTYFLFMDGRP